MRVTFPVPHDSPPNPRTVSFSHQNIKSESDHCLCKMRSDRQTFKCMLTLIEKLKQVKDFRKDKGKRGASHLCKWVLRYLVWFDRGA
ncbi:MAG: hypothetical protein EWV40_04225 [Microcystis flos-aquae Mf_WU_F_19750830_S460]|uniref:Uncharacterized protein n=1 Tax=Microcystis flos-aquae Mf_WU_F_19750830_S460 TaxID=2486237 RepID=A0A552LZV7_9CHRO|nr:MAG: hypothetical protein EWV40_04225 [Microcystis flos-aquae Mf_WU_F_19750830_S460]